MLFFYFQLDNTLFGIIEEFYKKKLFVMFIKLCWAHQCVWYLDYSLQKYTDACINKQ
jgi:hypothetical protein